MERRSHGTRIMVALIGLTALAMLLPAAVGFTLREHMLARAFLYSAALLTSIAGLVYLAIRNAPSRGWVLSHPFYYLTLAYLILPALMAIPMVEAVPGLRYLDAWFEMVSAFTTTGASVIEGEGTLSLHLWRALVGWGGGLFVLVTVMALLAPLNLGGFELIRARSQAARDSPDRSGAQASSRIDSAYSDKNLERLRHQFQLITPVYFGLTLVLWVGLSIAGNPPLVALMMAMSTLATSGIATDPVLSGGVSEGLIALLLLLAVSRSLWPGAPGMGAGPRLQDLELRTGFAVLSVLIFVMAILLVARGTDGGLWPYLAELWGVAFTSLSFLTTTGFISGALPADGGVFAGPAGIALLGLALFGGGVATTAGGLKLLRVFSLYWQARFEVSKLVYPESVGGDGPRLRGLRTDGALAAWLFVMIFIFTLTAMTAALTVIGEGLEDAIILAVAALTTTGPLAQIAGSTLIAWAALSDTAKVILAFGMVLGRLEMLLLLSVFWRR
ncbi:MAG: TrkH family potassium uptake protein [Rhodobacteraceae bacterium]|nr:MAG: TrkH family potassium uptake protein [Paracoccaceae bacterium]